MFGQLVLLHEDERMKFPIIPTLSFSPSLVLLFDRYAVYRRQPFDGRIYKALFGCDGTVPLGDRSCCENDLLSALKRSFVWDNGTVPSQPNRA